MPTDSQLAAAAPHLPVVRYDGACAFCTAQAARVVRVSRGKIAVRPLQQALADVPWVDPDAALQALHLVDHDGRTYVGSAAVVRLMRLTRPTLGAVLHPYHLPGVRQLAEAVYAFIAARRYAIAGRVDPAENGCVSGACGMPWAERSKG
jgi:Uncharacterized protein conserved in bacteria